MGDRESLLKLRATVARMTRKVVSLGSLSNSNHQTMSDALRWLKNFDAKVSQAAYMKLLNDLIMTEFRSIFTSSCIQWITLIENSSKSEHISRIKVAYMWPSCLELFLNQKITLIDPFLCCSVKEDETNQ